MHDKLICILAKSAIPRKGRYGPDHLQDWYGECVKACRLMTSEGKIFISTAFECNGQSEAEVYENTLKEMGIKENQMEICCQGVETTEQLEAIYMVAAREKEVPVIISTFLHFPRVWWLTRGKKVEHRVAFGIPRPWEAVTDLGLTIAYPLIDVLGLKNKFLAYTKTRRKKGKI